MNNAQMNETIELPLPSDEQPLSTLPSNAQIEVDEIPQKVGHFSVDYRRC